MTPDYIEVEMFDASALVVEKPGKVRRPRRVLDDDEVVWSRHQPRKRVACDDCLAALVEAQSGPLAASARWRRRQGCTDRLVCDTHKLERRLAEERTKRATQ